MAIPFKNKPPLCLITVRWLFEDYSHSAGNYRKIMFYFIGTA